MNNNNNEINNNGCEHVQLGGVAYYDNSMVVNVERPVMREFFMFSPSDPVVGQVRKFRGLGVAQQMADGTFDFVRKPYYHAKSKLIKKLAHGRASETKDGAIQLTLKVFTYEGINVSEAMLEEAIAGIEAIREYQLKK